MRRLATNPYQHRAASLRANPAEPQVCGETPCGTTSSTADITRMTVLQEIRFPSCVLIRLDGGRFLLRDAHDHTQVLLIPDDDVPLLIHYLYEWSCTARQSLHLEPINNQAA